MILMQANLLLGPLEGVGYSSYPDDKARSNHNNYMD